MRLQRPFGTWDSPITARGLGGEVRLSDVGWSASTGTLVWREERSGQGVLVAGGPGLAPRDLTGGCNVRAQVGYGGGDFAVHDDAVFFAGHPDGCLYRQALATGGGAARPITPAHGKAAAPAVSPDGRWVAYVHHDSRGVDRLAVVDAHGRHWPQILAEGRDFYMQPRFSPDGRTLAWVCWDHPNMPWDGALLHVADVVTGGDRPLPLLAEPRAVAGGSDVAALQPEFGPGGELFFLSDETGWWHLYAHDLATGATRQLTQGDADHGQPAWAQGMRSFALSPDGRQAYVVRSQGGVRKLWRLDAASGAADAFGALGAYTDVDQPAVDPVTGRLAVLASSSTTAPRLVVVEPDGAERIVAHAAGETVAEAALARAEAITWPTADGETAHGLLYRPASERFQSAGLPPLVVLVHGGPTSQARSRWDPAAQFLATRGYAVLQLNYRGSSGFGRAYMQRLRGCWGVCDVQDAVSALAHLDAAGVADGRRAAIMGGSAGGYTVLQTMVTQPDAFAAGVCLYGVADLFHLARQTHKFELRYLDSLVGPLPAAAEAYRERSPVRRADRIRRPLAVFQGADDPVVPRAQSDAVVEALRRNGTPHVYHVYEGEGHGWRKAETIDHFWRTVEAFLMERVVFD